MTYENLFSPITINGMTLRNRTVMPAMGTGYGNADSTISDRLMAYLARRARGGAGLIISEVCAVIPRGKGFPNEIGAWDDEFIPGLAKLADAVHREGGKVALQLHHAGRETFEMAAGGMPEAPSAIPSVVLNQPCEAMSLERIAVVTEAFAKAAGRAKKAGLDAVEIHGAHGYLLTQFLSPFSNRRTDAYGGSEENRMRFVLEVVESVRKEVGPDFPVLIRVSADELIRGGYDLEFMKRLAPRLVAAGVDAIHASVGVYSTPGHLSIASMDTEPGFNLFRARAVRDAVNVPVIAVGRIADPVMADHAIARGDADLISFGRQHLTDPDFVNKVRAGDMEDIRWCVACNQGCIERLMFEMKSATCTFNPECGQEFRGAPAGVAGRKCVYVVGAGPAGLSAALAAMARGCDVQIFEKESEPGGQLRSAIQPPHKRIFRTWMDWALRRLARGNVNIQYGRDVTEELLREQRPDAVILAAGACPWTPDIPGIKGPRVFDARDVLTGKTEVKGPAVILGAGYVGMETADFLIARGVPLTILEMQPLYPVGKLTAHGYFLHQRIKEGGGKILIGARVTNIDENFVAFTQGGEEKTLPAAMVITAMGAKPDNALEKILGGLGIDYRIVGDAKSPRRLLEAIHEGDQAGRTI
jgi:2,4-dienoyl-CoA reductase-like NADH-dependent reductase (Old Yellow Enzyme family)/thioredoxin reductase